MIRTEPQLEGLYRQLAEMQRPLLVQCAIELFNHAQYEDGEVVVFSNNPKYEVVINGDQDESPSFATGFAPINGARLAILKTAEGGLYGIGRGILMSYKHRLGEQTIQEFEAEEFQAVVGKPIEIPEIGTTREVESMMFRLEFARQKSGGSFGSMSLQFPYSSPFITLDNILRSNAENYFGFDTNAVTNDKAVL